MMMLPDSCCRRRSRSLSTAALVVATTHLLFLSGFSEGKLQCVCTTPECDRDGTATCRADNFCYVQLIPPVSGSAAPGAVASASRRPGAAVTRGCIDHDTPLLCENKRPSTYRGAWPVLHCCRDDWCNHNVLPTLPPWASHVEEVQLLMATTSRSKLRDDDENEDRDDDDDDDDTTPLTASVVGRRPSVSRPTRAPTDDDHRSAVGSRDLHDWTSNPLYVGVAAACAGVLLSLAVLGMLLVRYGRDRRGVDGRGKSAALLPSHATSPPSPSRHLAVELSRSREPCVCLQCNRPIFVPPATAAYSPVETRS